MSADHSSSTSRFAQGFNSRFATAALACAVAALSYLATQLGSIFVLRPEMVWPLWPGCAFLVAVLLLAPRKTWPLLLAAGLAGFALYDLQEGLPIRSISLLILADIIEIAIAAFGVTYALGEMPRLNSLKSLATYSFFAVVLAPISVTFIGSAAFAESYWVRWRIGFFTEALALLTLTPAILGWAQLVWPGSQRPPKYYVEATALFMALSVVGYIALVTSDGSHRPAFLYSLVPFLLWSALRFGTTGVSTSMIVIALFSIWGAIHGRGPFTGSTPMNNVLTLQLFFLFAAASFMVLAALVEERATAGHALRESEQRLRLAAQAGKMYAFAWDAATDVVVRSEHSSQLVDIVTALPTSSEEIWARIHSDDRELLKAALTALSPAKPTLQITHRIVNSDGTVTWVERHTRADFDGRGRMLRMIGMVVDVTEHKRAEQVLSELSGRLLRAQEEERARIARELHDDVSQRMALLQIHLTQFEQSTPELSSTARQELKQILDLAAECSSELHDISHQLHPSRLDTLGLVAAVRSLCREFSAQHNFEVQFLDENVPRRIPKDVSLCVFRIVQEALRNVVKHSGAGEAKVELAQRGDQLELRVSDAGSGFDPSLARGEGLGLMSMRERLGPVRGSLAIDSEVSHGTSIQVRIPLPGPPEGESVDVKRLGASA